VQCGAVVRQGRASLVFPQKVTGTAAALQNAVEGDPAAVPSYEAERDRFAGELAASCGT
jgi:hypothetical protein